MISLYKWKKNAVFALLGTIPLIIFLMLFFSIVIKPFIFEGLQFIYIDFTNLLIAILITMVIALIIMFVGNRLLKHAFTQMLEGKGLLTFILDSTGVIASFNVQVNAPDMKGRLPQKNAPEINDIYDTDMQHRLLVPKNATMTQAVTFEKNNNKIVFGKSVDVLVLPTTEDNYDKRFSFENRPVFIFNKVMNKFLSRDALATYEKDIEIKHNALNILKRVLGTDESFKNFGRYIGENIKPVKKSFFASPIIKYILIGAVIFMIILIIMMFVPGIFNAASNVGLP